MKRVCMVGPMLSESGFVKTQGEILADLLEQDGYKVFRKSKYRNRIIRFSDTLLFLLFRFNQYDVVIIQVYGGLSFVMEDAASFIAGLFKKEIVFTLHGGALPDFLSSRQRWAKRVFSRATHITCPSQYLIDKLSFIDLEIIEIPNIIILTDYSFKSRPTIRPRIFWMRAYHAIYNPLLALAVFEKLCEQYNDAIITLAGPDMGQLLEVQSAADASKYSGRIKILGLIDLAGKQLQADEHDIYLNTNVIDNTPVSMIEMAAMGVALVSTRVGGIPYLFKDKSSALLSSSGTADDLVRCIAELVDNRELAKKVIEGAQVVASRFDWHQVRNSWYKIV